jgi:hypothetical protein
MVTRGEANFVNKITPKSLKCLLGKVSPYSIWSYKNFVFSNENFLLLKFERKISQREKSVCDATTIEDELGDTTC